MKRLSSLPDLLQLRFAQLSATGVGGVALAAVAVAFGGCRGRAQEDLYRQTLQREVRQLEDQLYEADYENRILIDKLRRERAAQQPDCSDALDPGYVPVPSEHFDLGNGFDDPPVDDAFHSQSGSNGSHSTPTPLRDRKAETIPRGDSTPDASDKQQKENRNPSQIPTPVPDPDTNDDLDGLPDMDSLIDPGTLVDPGQLVDPGNLLPPTGSTSPDQPRSGTLQTPVPTPPTDSGPSGGFRLPGDNLLPPPGGPTPPGTDDLRIDPIEPGIPAPPNSPNGRPDGPPGKIDLPGVSMLGGLGPVAGSTPKIQLQPTKIQIDAASSNVRALADSDSDQSSAPASDAAMASPPVPTEGVDVVIRANDQYGHPIALLGRSHDPTDALRPAGTAAPRPLPSAASTLSIIALDPTKTGEDAHLGRWDFDTEQIRQLETTSLATVANGFAMTVPIRWRERVPQGESVVFFARLQSPARDLRCESQIELKKQPSMAGWLPRK